MKKYFIKLIGLFAFFLLFTSVNEIKAAEYIQPNNSEVKNYTLNSSNKSLLAVSTKDENNSTDNNLATVFGKVQLPEGDIAPEGGIRVKISCLAEKNNFCEAPSYSTTVMIEEGAAETSYELKCPNDRIKLKYELIIEKSVKTIIPYERILYTGANAKVSKTKKKIRSVHLIPPYRWVFNIILQRLENPADYYDFPTIDGIIKLPEGEVAPKNGLEIKVCSYPFDKNNEVYEEFYDDVFSEKVKIPQGKNEVKYTLTSPKGPRILTFILQGATEQKYLSVFHYSKNGSVSDLASASTIRMNNNLHGLNVTLKKLNSINGTIKIPKNIPVLNSELLVVLSLYNIPSDTQSLSNKSTFIIPPGKREIDYSLKAMPGKYIIKFEVQNPKKALPVSFLEGYIGKNDTVEKKEDANIIILKDKDINIGNLILKQAPCLEGFIALPDNKRVPNEDLLIYLVAINITDSSICYITDVTIPENENWAIFSLPVKSGTYTLQYLISPSRKNKLKYEDVYDYSIGTFSPSYFQWSYMPKAYYTEDGLIKHFKITTDSISNIAFKLANKKYIEGELIVPKQCKKTYVNLKPVLLEENELPSSAVKRMGDNVNGWGQESFFLIPLGTEKVKFKFPEQDGNYILMCKSGDSKIFSHIFYSEGEATLDASKCKIVSSTDKDVQSISIKLPKAKHIQGTLSIPKNKFGFKDDTRISIELIKLTDENEMALYDMSEVTLKKYSSEVDYDFMVESGEYILNYIVKTNTKHSSYSTDRYYYKKNGCTKDPKEAFVIDVEDDDIENINITLVKK